MRQYFEERALRLAYRLIYFAQNHMDINADAKLEGAKRYIAEVVTTKYGLQGD